MNKTQLIKRIKELKEQVAEQKEQRSYDIIKLCRMNARYADDINTLNLVIVSLLGGNTNGTREDEFVKPPKG